MTMPLPQLAAVAAAAGMISPDELLALRQSVWADGRITPDEAEAIFAINQKLTAPARDWVDFFVEALSVWLVDQQQPEGYVDAAQARWLIDRIDAEGRPATLAELELLAKVLERAVSTPAALRDYAVLAIEHAVLHGFGPTRDGAPTAPGRITAAEVLLLRRLIFASGDDRPASVSQREAEMLFRIKDATLGGDNAPEWQALFVKGVADYLQGFGGFSAPDRACAAELDAFMNRNKPGLLGVLGRMMDPGATAVLPDLRAEHLGRDPDKDGWRIVRRLLNRGVDDDEMLGHDLESAARRSVEVTPQENAWLHAEIDADGQLDRLEQALLDFLTQV